MEYSYIPINDFNQYKQGGIHDLTYDEFEQVVSSNTHLSVIMFYTTWSHSCDNIMPQYEKISSICKSSNIRFFKINANINDDTVVKCNSCITPSFHFYMKGHKLCQLTNPTVKELTNKINEINK